jgi:hypothetical protein
MALRNKSVVTVEDPQFINLEPNALNPCISECEIKVMYLGKNRNGSYMDKQSAINMANTLPGTPIVAAYHEDTEDFGDHGDVIHIENGEITFTCATVPYGFVSPDAKVWFQKFVDTDEFGNEIEREYMMTTGYLWTGQYPEITKCITEGQGQSMELEDVDGHWATDSKDQVDFFIINDATITKLCVLGDKVEPCFEGASVTDLDVSKEFSMGRSFNQTLFSMMNELKNALENEGGSNMPEEIQETEEVVEAPAETEALEEQGEDSADFASDKKEEDKEGAEEEEGEEKPAEEEEPDEEEEPEEEEKPKKDHSLEESESVTELVEKFEALKCENESLKAELESLRSFKLEREIADKDVLIAKYHMLSEEDKAEVEAHKAEYSLEEIESKLALIYVQKNVDFSTVDGTPEAEVEAPTSFTLVDNEVADETDFMLQALREAKKN